MINFEFRLSGFGERITIFRHGAIEPADRFHDPVAVDDRPRLQAEAVTESLRIWRYRSFQTGQGNRIELVARTRLHVDDDINPFRAIGDEPRLHDRVIIAFYSEQPFDQFGIALRPPPDLSKIGILVAILLQNRQYIEARVERLAERVGQAFKAYTIGGFRQSIPWPIFIERQLRCQKIFAGLKRLILDFLCGQGWSIFGFAFIEHRFRHLIQIGPFDTKIREFGQRLVGVERRIKLPLILGSGNWLSCRLRFAGPDERTHQQNDQHAEAATMSGLTHCRISLAVVDSRCQRITTLFPQAFLFARYSDRLPLDSRFQRGV